MSQTHAFRGTARSIISDSTGRRYCYHRTAVVTVKPDGSIVLDSGRWRTVTTKLAMNQASNQDGLGFHVFQKDHTWFVCWRGETVPFADGMCLRSGE